MNLLGGQPYLTRQALYTIVTENLSWSEFTGLAASDMGPFTDHLRRQLWLLKDETALQDVLRQIGKQGRANNDDAIYRLLRAGLIKGSGQRYVYRCGLYRQYFEDKLWR